MQATLFEEMKKTAIISDCGKYRYELSRIWDESKPKVLFIMLNPSTADADIDDPTIRRCIGFAKSWGFGGLYVGNLFAFRSPNPKDLLTEDNPVGKMNCYHLNSMSLKCDMVVCAWGNKPILNKMKAKMPLIYDKASKRHYIELSKDGTPKHPLYLKGDLKPNSF